MIMLTAIDDSDLDVAAHLAAVAAHVAALEARRQRVGPGHALR